MNELNDFERVGDVYDFMINSCRVYVLGELYDFMTDSCRVYVKQLVLASNITATEMLTQMTKDTRLNRLTKSSKTNADYACRFKINTYIPFT